MAPRTSAKLGGFPIDRPGPHMATVGMSTLDTHSAGRRGQGHNGQGGQADRPVHVHWRPLGRGQGHYGQGGQADSLDIYTDLPG